MPAPRTPTRLLCLAAILLTTGVAAAQEADWIWLPAEAAPNQEARFLRHFRVEGEVVRATLTATCDNHLRVLLNGAEVARSAAWEQPVRTDVTEHLRRGRNVLAADCRNDGGPAALAVRLELRYADGRREFVTTSDAWRAGEEAEEGWTGPGFALSRWGRARVLGSTADASLPWGTVMAHREATPAEAIRLPEGFEAELVHSAQPGEGSWVSLALDGQGRAIVSPETGGLLRLTRIGPEQAEVERLGVNIGMCQGLLFAHGALYASVAENADRDGGLHRLRDADGDGAFETHEVLARFPMRSEHGPHGLALGPDGLIYTVHGNYTPLPQGLDPEASPYRAWHEDVLLPRLWDPRGHAVNVMAPGGRVLRTDPDGRRWEIVAGGLRNAYDLAFAPNGELFTYDSDMEWDIGLPWYRPPRVVHVVEGGEYGWRSGSAKMPDWYPDTLPPVVETDLSSPVGMAFATPGMFPEPWAGALFAGDWAYGRILAVHLEPDGASWAGEYETFALGLPLSVTDIAFDADGAMWFVTGGRGTQSGLYRVTYRGAEPAPERPRMGSLPVELSERRFLARAPAVIDADDRAALPTLGLSFEDRTMRFTARAVLDRVGSAAWRTALEEAEGWVLAPAIARSTVLDLSTAQRVDRILAAMPPDADSEGAVSVLRALQICAARGGGLPEESRRAVLARLDGLYPSGEPRADHLLRELLTHCRAPGLAERLLGQIESPGAREPRLHAAVCLRLVADQLDADQIERYFRWLHEARSVPGGMSLEGYMRAIEREAMERLGEAERTRIGAMLATLDEAEQPPATPARPFVRHWTLDEALSAIERAGPERSLERGRRLFAEARCAECHRFDGAGGATGPDLTGVARRFSTRDLLEAIIDPFAVVSDQYRASVVTLRDGRVLTGRLLQITGGRMDLLTDPYSLKVVSVEPGEIESVEPSPISPMPPGLLDTLTPSEVADLIAYLERGGSP